MAHHLDFLAMKGWKTCHLTMVLPVKEYCARMMHTADLRGNDFDARILIVIYSVFHQIKAATSPRSMRIWDLKCLFACPFGFFMISLHVCRADRLLFLFLKASASLAILCDFVGGTSRSRHWAVTVWVNKFESSSILSVRLRPVRGLLHSTWFLFALF